MQKPHISSLNHTIGILYSCLPDHNNPPTNYIHRWCMALILSQGQSLLPYTWPFDFQFVIMNCKGVKELGNVQQSHLFLCMFLCIRSFYKEHSTRRKMVAVHFHEQVQYPAANIYNTFDKARWQTTSSQTQY